MNRPQDRLKRAVLGGGPWALGVAAVVFAHAAGGRAGVPEAPTIVEAREFRVVDADGKVRAILGMTAAGPVLILTDANGRPVWSTANVTPAAEVGARPKSDTAVCPTCMGKGHLGQCRVCEGTGYQKWPGGLRPTRLPGIHPGPGVGDCPYCRGTGMKPCDTCGGTGTFVPRPVVRTCPKCHGKGKIGRAGIMPCDRCDGKGVLP